MDGRTNGQSAEEGIYILARTMAEETQERKRKRTRGNGSPFEECGGFYCGWLVLVAERKLW